MKNGYRESLFPTQDGVCFVCGLRGDTARHEIFGGANRAASKREGLWICVCPRCHDEIHLESPELKKSLQRTAQVLYERKHTREDFMKLIGRNYL